MDGVPCKFETIFRATDQALSPFIELVYKRVCEEEQANTLK